MALGRWKLIRVALMMFLVSLLVIAGMVVVLAVLAVVMPDRLGAGANVGPGGGLPRKQPGGGAMAVGLAAAAGSIMCLAGLSGFVAQCMCIAVPRESGARRHAIGSVVLTVLAVLVLIIGMIFVLLNVSRVIREHVLNPPIDPRAQPDMRSLMMPATVIGVVTNFLVLGASAFFCLFLRKVATYFGKSEIASKATWLIGFTLFAVVFGSGLQIMQWRADSPAQANIAGVIVNLLWLALILVFAWGVARVWSAIQVDNLPTGIRVPTEAGGESDV